MMTKTYVIRGTEQDASSLSEQSAEVVITRSRRLLPGSARAAGVAEIEAAADEVVRVELENGFVLWTRTDDLIRERGRSSVSRDGGQAWEIDTRPALRGGQTSERGWLGLGIKVLEFFGVDLKGKTAVVLGNKLEQKLLGNRVPGLYRCSLGEPFKLVAVSGPVPKPAENAPILVLLHGTGSSCEGSFGKLWQPGNSEGARARSRFRQLYGDHVYALEHRSFTLSPIQNALDLVRQLPEGALIHLVSHSRGGLVGELLCLAQRDTSQDPLQPDLLQQLFAADRTMAEQLGLNPLASAAARARDDAYNADREALQELTRLLDQKRLLVQRFVRVACPARGTTLASGRLDRWLSVLDYLTKGVVGDCVDFLLAVVKERTDPRTLPGLEAMMPGSALTRMLQHPALVTSADLSVIAGDIEGDSLWSQIKLLATDWFYGADHDLVVNTGSMFGGMRRPERGARFLRDQGASVNHFNYFANDKSIRWLVAGLTRADQDDAGFQPLVAAKHEPPRWRQAVRRSRAASTPRPLAVVIPGTMGSALQVEGKTVWLSYWALLWGGLKRLHMGAREVEPTDVLDDFYGPLLEFLAHSHRVEIFPYDWRRSVRDAASELADRLEAWLPQAERNQQAVHLVAHSMGGLVVRAMIADGGRGAALWRRIVALPNSRFMMLGTPNLGSYEAVRWLTGCNPTQTKLSLLDLTQSGSDIVDLVRNFPGLVELLPFDGDSPDFSQRGLWKDLKDALHARWQPAEEQVLRQAQITWAQLKAAAPEPEHMVYVAGCQPATVTDYQLRDYEQDPDEGRSLAGLKRLQFMGVQQGDGTVTWKSGLLPGVPVWYVHDTAHDELCKQRSALPAYLDLLATGTTTRLAATPPAARAVTGAAQSFPMPAIPHTDDIPDERAARSLGFGPGRPFETDDRPAVPVIRVRMSHGDLAYARYPVLVGHYLGDTIIGAEAALNDRLGGVLEQRLQLGLYPERLRSHALFFNDDAHGSPAGAIVIGLGQVGELTSGLLEGGLRSALLDYALQVAQWQDDRFGPASGVRSAALSCLLVGSGPGGVMVRESVEAILRGAVAANEQLVAAGLDSRVLVDQIEFLELYEDVALSAAEALDTILDSGQLAGAVRWPEKVIEPGQGRRRRVRAGEAPGWWQRLEIVEEKASGGLRFIALTNRARAEVTQSSGQLQLADRFVSEASRSASSHSDIAKTLFEILLPNRLKQMAPDQRDMVLLVDSASARYPWEMLEDRWSQSGRPIAVAAGMVRQLKTPAFRAHPAHASGATAFVVGNPNLGGWQAFADLPGARQEARTVTELLRSSGYRVNDCIDAKAGAIVDGLHQDSWRILHLAGHGEYQMLLEDDDDSAQLCADGEGPIVKCERRITGMVIGDHTFLTPGDVEQMRWVPEVVFINCCHLGKTGASARGHYGLLAANLGVQFINMGVKVVVAAGWAVDDAAASAFAERFYSQLLRGETFGEAVRVARQEIWSRFPGVNTWGAYQCYGDPGYRLQGDGAAPRRSTVQRYYAPAELIAKLENYTEALRVASKNPDDEQQVLATMRKEIVELYGSIAEEQRSQWLGRADVAAAVGFAWGETGAWEEAVEWLEKALAATAGDCPVRVLEQCANFRVRLAFERWQQSADLVDADQGEVVRAASISDIERAIMELDYIAQRAPTAERLNLLGSACKRLARMCGEQEHRLEALVNMAAYYRRAIDQDDRPDPYPFSNWAIAKLLALRLDPNLAAQWLAGLQDECLRMIDAARVRNEARPNFWDGVGQADCELVLLLTAPNITLEQAGARASCIAELYRGAAKRGVSPREYASVLEHLEFIVALGEFPTGSPLEVALAAIRGAL